MDMLNTITAGGIYQFLLMIPVFFGAYYVSRRILYGGAAPRSRPRRTACAALTLLGAGCLAYTFLSHLEIQIRNASLNRVLVWISGIYVSLFVYFLLALTALDLTGLILRRSGRGTVPARLRVRISAGAAVLITLIGAVHARSIRTVHYDLSAEEQLPALLRIVEVSDLHMGPVIGTAYVRRVVDAVNACRPDLVVFPGDQFNRTGAMDVVGAEAVFEALSRIEAPLGTYAVLGNHDPELDSEIYQKFLAESGITALDNGVLEIVPDGGAWRTEVRTLVSASPRGSESAAARQMPAAGAVLLAGRTKLAGSTDRVPLAKLLDEAGVPVGSGAGNRDYCLLVLDHDPGGIAEAVSCGADLVLAGHTHGGQYFPATLLPRLLYGRGYSCGLARTFSEAAGRTTVSIVSSGAGYFQIPVRIGTDSEIVCVDLRPQLARQAGK